uniref:GT23 domain-containing protein n=1 Tax=Meloidogyne enterolobii TaxID=390850 RepID=A0A6V7U1E7_MELEN|nr:unnamed protein product [Meloidogyne enterolobii]
MTLAQKYLYLRNLYNYNSARNDQQTHFIYKQIISDLSTERMIHTKQNNSQKLTLLSETIQNAINSLQNPLNCSEARILVCPIDGPNWGFGFLTHQIRNCLTFAMKSGRTMVIQNDKPIYKFNATWNDLFMPASNCSFSEHAQPFLPLNEYLDIEQSDRILIFQHRLELRISAFRFVPIELKNLLKYHSNPTIWFHGQLVKYIWRINEITERVTKQFASNIPFECGPVVGIHVRRTDKISEAKLHDLEEYMEWVDFWFDVMDGPNLLTPKPSNCTNRRMLFIASDLPALKNVVEEANSKWSDKYEIYFGKFNTTYDSKEALAEIIAVTHILAKCQFLVCTFSSNACQVTYEFMQSIQGDASENAYSLDYFYNELWFDTEMEATAEYKPIQDYPLNPDEMWAEKGDIIVVKSPIDQNGYIRGKNPHLNSEGRFPMYLLKEHLIFDNFSVFFNISI